MKRKTRTAKTNGKNSRKVIYGIGNAVLALIGFVVVPPLLKKFGNKLYKASLKTNSSNR